VRSSSWVAVTAIVLLLGYILLNTLRTEGVGSRGVPNGETLPPFAVPTDDNPDDEVPANTLVTPRDGAPKACDVDVPQSFTSCSLTARTPAVIAFLAAPSERCTDEVDRLQRLLPRFEDRVSFAVVSVRGDRKALRTLVRDHGWTMPVGHDTDGRVANAYGIAVCPTITLAAQGGKVVDTVLGEASQAELERRIGKLVG
jgi:peroxiredoxin